VRKVLQKSHEAQMEHWKATGAHAQLMHDASKAAGVTSGVKISFGNDGSSSSSNARRKTTTASMPLGSPNSQNIKSTMHNNMHNVST